MSARPKSKSLTETPRPVDQQDVRRLDVAVDDAVRVSVREALEHLGGRLERAGVAELARPHRLAQRPAGNVLVDDVDVAGVARERVRAQAARVPEPRRRGRLALGPRAGRCPRAATILSATSRPVSTSRASQTEPEPPVPSGRIGR